MNYGSDDVGFYIEFRSKNHEVGNIRQEYEYRARQIYKENDNIILGISGGLDSQVMLHSFLSQGLNVKTSFMHYGKYNDNELEKVKKIDKKYGIETQVFLVDPVECYQELKALATEHDIMSPYSLLYAKFLSLLPKNYTLIQCQGPDLYSQTFTNKDTKKTFFITGYYDNTISRHRTFDIHKRKTIFFPNFEEHILSLMNDDVFISSLCISDYWTDIKSQETFRNELGLFKRDTNWDKYIKPFIFGKYWKDELMYFPKFSGLENVMDVFKDFGPDVRNEGDRTHYIPNKKALENTIMIPIKELYDILNSNDNITKKYYLKYVAKRLNK
jgi:hypothetical protein